MSRQKRIKTMGHLRDVLEETGNNLTGSLRSSSIDRVNEMSPDLLDSIPSSVAQPLGRVPGHNLSIDDENRLYSVLEAFDDGVLNTLSPRERSCFSDVIISGDTYDEVAVRYSITKGAVQTYVKRAALHIRKHIDERDGPDGI